MRFPQSVCLSLSVRTITLKIVDEVLLNFFGRVVLEG